jgi:two-component system cell cycle sensor histidine kinase/response regulator CckA
MYFPNTTAWLRLDEASQKHLLENAVREAARRSPAGSLVYSATIAAVLLGSTSWHEHPALTIAAFVGTFLAGLYRWIASIRLQRQPALEPYWALLFRVSTLLTVGIWGAFCAANLYYYTDRWPSTYLLIVGAAFAGGVASSLASQLRLGLWALVLIVLPTAVCGLLIGTTRSLILGVSTCVYLAYLTGQIRQNSNAYWKVATASALDAMLSRHAATRSEIRFQTLFEDAPSGIYLAFLDGRIEMANRALAQLLGFATPEEIAGRNLKEFSPDYDRIDRSGPIEATGYLVGWESNWHSRDGAQIRVHESIRAVHAGTDDEVRVLGIVEDITARFMADRARRQLIDILEGTSDFVERIAATGETLYMNRASRALLGAGEAGAATARTRNRSEYSEVMQARLRLADRDGIWQGESWLQAADGRTVPVSQVIISHKSSDGSTHSYSIISRDISAMRETQRALQESQEQLFQGQRLESLGRLAGGIAHDFNNLLTVIMVHTSVLEPAVQTSEVKEGIAEIGKAAARAADLTRQLLAFGRKQVLSKGVVDVKEIVRGAERMLRRLIGERIELVTRLSQEPQTVFADAAQLEQVLVNLILNARDAMLDGGVATIETSTITGGSKGQGDGSALDFVRITVSDTGIGMDNETAGRVFEPFFTTKGPGKGTGLGLATTYGFIKQSGGSISVSSTPGGGTVFSILLPKCSGAVVAEPQPVKVSDPGGSEHILVVDDEPALRGLLRQALAGCGYRVAEARDAAEALVLARGALQAFDLLVTDVIMPGITGPQLAVRLKAEFPEMAVLFVSGYPGETVSERAAFGPGAGYLAKPFTIETLLQHVRKQLEQRKAIAMTSRESAG